MIEQYDLTGLHQIYSSSFHRDSAKDLFLGVFLQVGMLSLISNLFLATISSWIPLSYLSTLFAFLPIAFDDMDSIYASPDDFKSMKRREKARGLHLLEYFVNRCHDIGVGGCHFFSLSTLAQMH